MSAGIAAVGVYLPRLRVERAAVAAAQRWANPSLDSLADGEFAAAAWDEDCVTMAHEAARRALATSESMPLALSLCSTTFPFADRSHSALLTEALPLDGQTVGMDIGASRRAATTRLLASLRAGGGGELIVAADRPLRRPASHEEIVGGDGAAAVVTTSDEPLLEFLGGASRAVDLVDRYRAVDSDFAYDFEERWVRDTGWFGFVPDAIATALDVAGIAAGDVARLAGPMSPRLAGRLAKRCGLGGANVESRLSERAGDPGVATPLLALAEMMETMDSGEHVVVLGFGQGVDAIVLRATERLVRERPSALSSALDAGATTANYLRYLSDRGLVAIDWGKRAERDRRTAQSAYFRARDQISGFVGGRCTECGTVQFPRSKVCVNPECREVGEQAPYRFAAETGRIKSFTEDWQAYSPAPPLIYGNVEFEGGANVLMECADAEPGDITVGSAVEMRFRIKDFDTVRDYRRYFWKAVPLRH